MNATFDLLGDALATKPFKDIRDTKPTVAEEKATLCLELSALCRRVPKAVASGSIQSVRLFMESQKEARKVCAGKDSSRAQLLTAINRLKEFGA